MSIAFRKVSDTARSQNRFPASLPNARQNASPIVPLMRPNPAAIRTKNSAASPASGIGESLVSQVTVANAIRLSPTVIITKKVLLNLINVSTFEVYLMLRSNSYSWGGRLFRSEDAWERSGSSIRLLSSLLYCSWMQNAPFVRRYHSGRPEARRTPCVVEISVRDFQNRGALNPVNQVLRAIIFDRNV